MFFQTVFKLRFIPGESFFNAFFGSSPDVPRCFFNSRPGFVAGAFAVFQCFFKRAVHSERAGAFLATPFQGNAGSLKLAFRRAWLARDVEHPMYSHLQALILNMFGSDPNLRGQMRLSPSLVFAAVLVGKGRLIRTMGTFLVVMYMFLAVFPFPTISPTPSSRHLKIVLNSFLFIDRSLRGHANIPSFQAISCSGIGSMKTVRNE